MTELIVTYSAIAAVILAIVAVSWWVAGRGES